MPNLSALRIDLRRDQNSRKATSKGRSLIPNKALPILPTGERDSKRQTSYHIGEGKGEQGHMWILQLLYITDGHLRLMRESKFSLSNKNQRW